LKDQAQSNQFNLENLWDQTVSLTTTIDTLKQDIEYKDLKLTELSNTHKSSL